MWNGNCVFFGVSFAFPLMFLSTDRRGLKLPDVLAFFMGLTICGSPPTPTPTRPLLLLLVFDEMWAMVCWFMTGGVKKLFMETTCSETERRSRRPACFLGGGATDGSFLDLGLSKRMGVAATTLGELKNECEMLEAETETRKDEDLLRDVWGAFFFVGVVLMYQTVPTKTNTNTSHTTTVNNIFFFSLFCLRS